MRCVASRGGGNLVGPDGFVAAGAVPELDLCNFKLHFESLTSAKVAARERDGHQWIWISMLSASTKRILHDDWSCVDWNGMDQVFFQFLDLMFCCF